MDRVFNVNGTCYRQEHYMVNLDSRLKQIKELIDHEKYFVINRGRQYGKTTILWALQEYLRENYVVLFMDFQQMSTASFRDEFAFSEAFIRSTLQILNNKRWKIKGVAPESIWMMQRVLDTERGKIDLPRMFECFTMLCEKAEKPVVLTIDEVDYASNNQVFLDFLSQLRSLYLSRRIRHAFQSVILAGVYDIKNLKQKIRQDGEHRFNSPWNIAADFNVDMSFSVQEISGMLLEYEQDHHIGMHTEEIAELIFDYTNGYPYMVSRICQLIDEQMEGSGSFSDKCSAWSRAGVLEAVKHFLALSSTLFDDMVKKMNDFPELKKMLKGILFYGKKYGYERDNPVIHLGVMFGFLKNENNLVMVANRIFETKLYNIFLSEEETKTLEDHGYDDKNLFVENGRLNMKLIMVKFVEHFDEVYGDCSERFLEENGRRYFLLYLRPIINGVGNYYVEAQTRNHRRTDIIVDYRGEQFVIELKIWHGDEYNKRGEQQLFEYLEFYKKNEGYLLSFNFNEKKKKGVRHILFQGKEIIEAVV